MKILDICCGSGGASVGIELAGHRVEGLDIEYKKNYPFKFHLGDALKTDLTGYDAYFCSIPCQAYSWASANHRYKGKEYPRLYKQLRKKLIATGKPFVLECVIGSPLRKDLVLCGSQFGLGVYRHRIFEIHGFMVPQKKHKPHKKKVAKQNGIYTIAGHHEGTLLEWSFAMGIAWMDSKHEIAQAVPPMYTKYIFSYLDD